MHKTVSIGDFSRMTHLSIKKLRHYHDLGLLIPAEIDEASGYRYYAMSQVPIAQIIRRFRELGMPLDEVRALLATSDLGERNNLILAHLGRLQDQLDETKAAVASLRALIEHPTSPISIEHRSVEETPALAVSERVSAGDLHAWWFAAFSEIRGVMQSRALDPAGPAGALCSTELFSQEDGVVVAFVPLRRRASPAGRVQPLVIPATELAIAVHEGAHADVDRTYGALGTHVAEHELGIDGRIREYYLVDRFHTPDSTRWRTEIGWPIFQARAG